jgi:hypothetical protein
MHRAWLMYKKNPVILIVVIPLLAGAAACGFAVAATWTYFPAPPIAESFIIAMVCPYPVQRSGIAAGATRKLAQGSWGGARGMADIISDNKHELTPQASLELAADFIITGLLANALLRSKTGWAQTDALISRVLRLMIETQVPPTIVAALLTMTVSAFKGVRHAALCLYSSCYVQDADD